MATATATANRYPQTRVTQPPRRRVSGTSTPRSATWGTSPLFQGPASPGPALGPGDRTQGTPGKMPKPGAEADNPLSKYLARFGVDYKDAPRPTPALLAFMRGLGMTMDTAEDLKSLTVQRLERRKADAAERIGTIEQRGRRSLTGNLASRGTLRSGEANTRFSRLDEDIGQLRTQKQRDFAEGVENAEAALNMTGDNLRQQMLERVLNTETTQAQEKAVSEANTASMKRQQEAADKEYERWRKAQDEYYDRQEQFYKTYGA